MAHILLTPAEVDALLNPEVYPEWDVLDTPAKTYYIEQASSFIPLNWDYTDDSTFDWEDDTTWPTHTDEGVAKYCNAAAVGWLYPREEENVPSEAPIKRQTEKVGSLEITTEYAQSDVGGRGPSQLRSIEDFMKAIGFTRIRGAGTLTRV